MRCSTSAVSPRVAVNMTKCLNFHYFGGRLHRKLFSEILLLSLYRYDSFSSPLSIGILLAARHTPPEVPPDVNIHSLELRVWAQN